MLKLGLRILCISQWEPWATYASSWWSIIHKANFTRRLLRRERDHIWKIAT